MVPFLEIKAEEVPGDTRLPPPPQCVLLPSSLELPVPSIQVVCVDARVLPGVSSSTFSKVHLKFLCERMWLRTRLTVRTSQ